MDHGNVVGYLIQVAGDMGGDQDGMLPVLDESKEDIQDLIPDNGVQAAGSLIQDKKLGMMAQCGCNG